MKYFGRFLIVTTLLAGCSHNPVAPEKPSYFSGTVPIAKGNTWVYQHRYSVENSLSWFQNMQYTQYRNNLFTMSIDSVSVSRRGDSVLFRVNASDTTIDSSDFQDLFAECFSYYFSKTDPVNTDSSADSSAFRTLIWSEIATTFPPIVYDKHTVTYYLLIKSSLFVRDTVTGFWKADSNGSLLSYKVPPDSSCSVPPYGESRNSSDYTRHSYSAIVTINSQDTGKYYTTEIAESQHFDGFITNIDAMLRWIENTGLFYKSNYIYFGVGDPYNVTSTENYSLISFNGSPISISQ